MELVDTTVNKQAENLNDKDFLYQKYTIEGANLGFLSAATGRSSTALRDEIRRLGLKRHNNIPTLKGNLPYGWKVKNGQLVVHHGEQATIEVMIKLNAEGYSLRKICAELDGRGIKTKTGNSWKPSTVMKILKRNT